MTQMCRIAPDSRPGNLDLRILTCQESQEIHRFGGTHRFLDVERKTAPAQLTHNGARPIGAHVEMAQLVRLPDPFQQWQPFLRGRLSISRDPLDATQPLQRE